MLIPVEKILLIAIQIILSSRSISLLTLSRSSTSTSPRMKYTFFPSLLLFSSLKSASPCLIKSTNISELFLTPVVNFLITLFRKAFSKRNSNSCLYRIPGSVMSIEYFGWFL